MDRESNLQGAPLLRSDAEGDAKDATESGGKLSGRSALRIAVPVTIGLMVGTFLIGAAVSDQFKGNVGMLPAEPSQVGLRGAGSMSAATSARTTAFGKELVASSVLASSASSQQTCLPSGDRGDGGESVPWLQIFGVGAAPPRQRDWVPEICSVGRTSNCSHPVTWKGTVMLCLNGVAIHGVQIHTRGHSSQFLPKHQFTVTLPRAHALLGMESARTWILGTSFIDASFQRNPTAFGIYRRLGGWATETRYVNMRWNGEDFGLYYLGETVKRLIRLASLKPVQALEAAAAPGAEMPGSFLLVADWAKPGNARVQSRMTATNFNLVYPEIGDVPASQAAHLQRSIDEVDRRAAEGASDLAEVLDFRSFSRYFILQELAKDVDGYAFSDFVLLRDQRLFHAAPWDFDLAFGFSCAQTYYRHVDTGKVCEGVVGWNVENARNSSVDWTAHGWQARSLGGNKRQLFLNVWRHPGFRASFLAAWRAARQGPLTDAALQGIVGAQSQAIRASAERDLRIWRPSTRCAFFPCCHPEDAMSFDTAQFHLQDFLLRRARWIDEHIAELEQPEK
mmetsp:Transcript_104833/g.224045  ORF Transcript_104833/g.224045 Transcript_104833/m.224045 type:complete len:564 (-) Transcript_104833:55-1746(-)